MENRYNTQFFRLKENQFKLGNTDFKERISKLKHLKDSLENTYKQRIREALYADFKKPQLEVDFTEIYPVIDEIKFAIKNLRFWLKPQPVKTPLLLLGSTSYIKYEAKGVCLIMAPWNFPINLTLGPLVSAVAAGNAVMVKPSEMTPNTSNILREIIQTVFNDDEVIMVQGGAETAQELLELPFNHIFFTGSSAIGKKIMGAASKHLCSVTLELGGKSPTIIDKSVNLEKVAEKIAFGKFINAGQTCIAPDYLIIDTSIKQDFVKHFIKTLNRFYGKQPSESSSYSNIVNEKHKERLGTMIEDAKIKGAELYFHGEGEDQSLVPVIALNCTDDMKLMNEEIFGPILPIITFNEVEEVIDQINEKEKPLAIYIFSKNKKFIKRIINNTRAGTTCVNHNLIQFLNHNLPFGGSNNSGIGKSHGFYGFKEFSNPRAILKQLTMSPSQLVLPPYNGFKQKIIDLTIKWL